MLLDVGAALLPCVPAVGSVRHAGKLDDIAKAGKKLLGIGADAGKAADNAADAAKVVDKGLDVGKGTRNPKVRAAIEKGNQKHKDFAEKVNAKEGWKANPPLNDPSTGRTVRPDAVSPSGRPVELKPNTPSGRKAGAKQLQMYEKLTGKNGRVVYYNPDL